MSAWQHLHLEAVEISDVFLWAQFGFRQSLDRCALKFSAYDSDGPRSYSTRVFWPRVRPFDVTLDYSETMPSKISEIGLRWDQFSSGTNSKLCLLSVLFATPSKMWLDSAAPDRQYL